MHLRDRRLGGLGDGAGDHRRLHDDVAEDRRLGRGHLLIGGRAASPVESGPPATSTSMAVVCSVASAPGSVITGSGTATSIGSSTSPMRSTSSKWLIAAPACCARLSTSASGRRPSTSSRIVR